MTPASETTSAGSVELIAFYLPQFHPTPENDEWWGRGFTEWRNVASARPLFRGHCQPRLPSHLGFYDLRLPETRERQAELAKAHNVSAFCYYHYWFNGRRPLSRPLDEVLASGKPEFPFCLCWANEDWTRAWDGRSGTVLIDQSYSEDDDRRHGRWLASVFADPRYLRVDGKPVMLVYRTLQMPDPGRTAEIWREEASRLGVGDILLCRVESFVDERGDPAAIGFDASVEFQPDWSHLGSPQASPGGLFGQGLRRKTPLRVYDYSEVVARMLAKPAASYRRFGCVTPSWDNTPRQAERGVVLNDSTPEQFERWLRHAVDRAQPDEDGRRIVFVNAWNEWAEGSYLEPDRLFGHEYLEAALRATTTGV